MLTKKDLLDALEPINTRLGRFEEGQETLLKQLQSLETGQGSLSKQVTSLETGQKSLSKQVKSLETGHQSLIEGQESLKSGLERIEKKLDESIQDNADLFNQTWVHLDKIQMLIEKRIKKIEDHLGFPQQ